MNPSSNENPGLNLPAPVSEQLPQQGAPNTDPGATNGFEAGLNEQPAQANTPGVLPTPSYPLPLPTPDPIAQLNDDTSTTSSVAGNTTHDSDLIDKHIVDRAKAIIEKTKDDPFKQTEEITVFKADHLYKNYNRQIKTKPNN